jgi:hypothetical protein
MFDEQREEMRRKQHEYRHQYRERKKAESQNNSASCALTGPLPVIENDTNADPGII